VNAWRTLTFSRGYGFDASNGAPFSRGGDFAFGTTLSPQIFAMHGVAVGAGETRKEVSGENGVPAWPRSRCWRRRRSLFADSVKNITHSPLFCVTRSAAHHERKKVVRLAGLTHRIGSGIRDATRGAQRLHLPLTVG